MPKAKPRYIHPIGAWSSPVIFTDDQKRILTEICNDQEFLDGVAEIVENYKADVELNDQLPSAAEDLATLKDLKDSISDLERKLSKLNGQVGAHLYKVKGDIRSTIDSLRKIRNETVLTINKHPKSKAGRPKDNAKRQAARLFKRLFDRHSIAWNISIYDSKESSKSTTSPAITVLSTFLVISPAAAADYVKGVCGK